MLFFVRVPRWYYRWVVRPIYMLMAFAVVFSVVAWIVRAIFA